MSTGSCHHTDKILSYEKQINHGFLADGSLFISMQLSAISYYD